MVSSLLIANRGEIALRVIRSARALGIRTIAVYSDADREAPHVRAASAAVHLGPTPAAESYLSIPALLEAAARTGADAVHPGYGFLSERADFAAAVVDAGLTFVGPSADVMEAMGRKDRAREIAAAAGVPVVPAHEVLAGGSIGSDVTFPVMVKAAAGGGGKGMRIVHSPDELPAALDSARREAASAFGDPTVLVEEYVEHARHVEVQVLADTHGNVVHLYDRDCSTQRRHQKVIEEAPAPTISAQLREQLTGAAVALAAEVGYVNAGTVEFIVDPAREKAYFLEMNTRLQVEHPVTELAVVVGDGERLDLVEQQLRIARGEALSFTQADVRLDRHAIEARIYAEDAFGGFLPQTGRARFVRWSGRSRNDVALSAGDVVTTAYDPMLGKVVVHGLEREAARKMLVAALDDTAVVGVTTNVGFVRAVAASREFREATIDTGWLDRTPDAVARPGAPEAPVFAVWAIADSEIRADEGSPFGTADGWRPAGPAAPSRVDLIAGGAVATWTGAWRPVAGPVGSFATRLIAREGDWLTLEIDGRIRSAAVEVTHRQVTVVHAGSTFTFERPDPFGPSAPTLSDDSVRAPMPGTVLDVRVAPGETVAEGDVLGVLEAMKMELALRAPCTGVVATVAAKTGDQVALGDVLFVMERDGAEEE
jgi:3-methylcrotonyl-CoA carboxylase alpha subunit/acetyl-CoA/propionyl-CoA carboxylase biotin carboxyl carrier protein